MRPFDLRLLSPILAAIVLIAASLGGGAKAGPFPDRTAEELLRHIYTQYVGKKPDDDITFIWIDDDTARGVFEPALAEAVIRAADSDDAPIDFDPFVDGQDFEIATYSLTTDMDSAERARMTASFVNFGEAKEVVYDLVATPAGWRIHDISWPQGSETLRQILKLE